MGKHVAPKCRAKNPETCTYHGKQNAADIVERGDVSAYLSFRESEGRNGQPMGPVMVGLDTKKPNLIATDAIQMLDKHMDPKTRVLLENYNGRVNSWLAEGDYKNDTVMQTHKDKLVKGLEKASSKWTQARYDGYGEPASSEGFTPGVRIAEFLRLIKDAPLSTTIY